MKHTLSEIKLILADLKLMFSHFMTGGNTDCHSKKVKTAHFIFYISNQPFPPSWCREHLWIDTSNGTLCKFLVITYWFSMYLEKQKNQDKKPTKSKKNIKTFKQTLQLWKMGLPIYQIQSYQKAPPKEKHIEITQKSPNCSWPLENIKCLQKNQQNLQKLLEY